MDSGKLLNPTEIINLLMKANPKDFDAFERVMNSILDNESDPNPGVADDDRDRWLVCRAWEGALTTVLDLMDTKPDHVGGYDLQAATSAAGSVPREEES